MATAAASKNFTHLIVLSEKDKECNGYVLYERETHTDCRVISFSHFDACSMLITHLPHGPTAFVKVHHLSYSVALHIWTTSSDQQLHARECDWRPWQADIPFTRADTKEFYNSARPPHESAVCLYVSTGVKCVLRCTSLWIMMCTIVLWWCFWHYWQTPQLEGRQVVTFHNQRDFIFVRHHRYIYRKENDKTRARLQELGPRFTMKLRWLQEGAFDGQHGEYEWIHKRKEMGTTRKKFFL